MQCEFCQFLTIRNHTSIKCLFNTNNTDTKATFMDVSINTPRVFHVETADRFCVVSTWNKRGAFFGFHLLLLFTNFFKTLLNLPRS